VHAHVALVLVAAVAAAAAAAAAAGWKWLTVVCCARGQAGLADVRKTVKTYAISMLLEHGFRAGDLANFAKKTSTTGEAAHVHRVSGVGKGRNGGQTGTSVVSSSDGLKAQLGEGKLVRAASAGLIM
tara:strand:+ start:189 stop:569 length:381 start_codon:yes stop_codon:yes gene_type:complete